MDSLLAIFDAVEDPRDFNVRHELSAMLFLALAATLCGAKSCVDIADFAAAHRVELGAIVDLRRGTPSHDSFSRLFRLLSPEQLETALCRFGMALRQGLNLPPAQGVVAIDGKRLRRGYERGKAHMPPLMVGVWDTETRLSLGVRGSAQGQEVKATLEVLKAVVLKGCTVTADALHCHPEMARTVCAQGADYVLKLKGNNGPLLRTAKAAFAAAEATGKLDSLSLTEHGHDRIERRTGSVVTVQAGTTDFPGLAAFGRIQSERSKAGGEPKLATHYVVMSQCMPVAVMMATTRQYWSIENQSHWPLDIVFREDDARTRKNYGPQNLSVIRRMALDILRAHPDQRSPARKMKLASWNKEFFYELFIHMR